MVVMGSSGPFGMCWVGFVARMLKIQLAFAQLMSTKQSCHSPSISPINILLVHTIILQYVHLMLIDGCDEVIWPIWYMLGWICGWDVINKWLVFAQLLSPNPAILHPYHQSMSC
jgi:hypothetical protein